MAIEQLSIPVITIDGPSGTGKGTLAHRLASTLGWHFLDSGALYRIVAVGAEKVGISFDDELKISEFAEKMTVVFSRLFPGSIELEGEELADLVRLEESGAKASVVAALPALRAVLLQRQRAFRQLPGLIADGRDMGTVVFPDSRCKFYLTASAEVRADRRYKQLINKGVDVSLRNLLGDIQTRDERDSTRTVAPLKPAEDAVIINTDMMNAEEVYRSVMGHINKVLVTESGLLAGVPGGKPEVRD